jgi:hypothetical protein
VQRHLPHRPPHSFLSIPFCLFLFVYFFFAITVGGECWPAGGMELERLARTLLRSAPAAARAVLSYGVGDSMAAGCCAQRYWAPLTNSLRFSRAREKRAAAPAAPAAAFLFVYSFLSIPFCLFLFRDYGWGRMLARGRDGARAIGARPSLAVDRLPGDGTECCLRHSEIDPLHLEQQLILFDQRVFGLGHDELERGLVEVLKRCQSSPSLTFGASLGYQLASIIAGGPAPIIATWLLATYKTGYAVSIYIAACAVISLVSAAFMPDYTGKDISVEYDEE